MDKRRIVITGMGTVNPLGNNVQDTWDKVVQGKSGIGEITKFDASQMPVRIAGEVKDFDYQTCYDENSLKLAKRMDQFMHFAAAGVKEALEHSGLVVSREPERIGICVGSGIGGIKTNYQNTEALISKGHRRVSPFYIPATIGNIASGFLSIQYGIKGPNLSLQTACATSNHSIGMGFLLLQAGMADVMIAGGAEAAITDIAVAGFANMRALSTRNDDPQTASRPYDKDRDGFVMGEGGAILVLEEYEHAKQRNADIICEVKAIGMTGDAYDIVIPDPEGKGAAASMQMALDFAKLNPEDLQYINAHGTATPLGDIAESKAIHQVLKGNQDNVNVGSTKSMHGHLLGATAGIEAIISAMALKHNMIPKNINIENFDSDVVLSCINTEIIEKEMKYVMSNSFGFGGHNSSLILGKM